MKHTISILVENEFGALARIAGLFSGRGYNIESLTVAPTLDPTLSRMTINTIGSDQVVEQIIKQLNKLINVVKVKDVTAEDAIISNLVMVKINLSNRNKEKVTKLVKPYDAKIIMADEKCTIVRVVISDEKMDELIDVLKPYGIMEFVSTGTMAIQKGKKVIK